MSGELTAKTLRVSAASTRRIVAVASLVAWLPAACLAIDAKYRLLEASGFEAVCDQLQRTIDPNRDPATYFSYFERLCLMRLDVTIAWALMPALLLVVTRRLRPSLAAAFVIACSSAATLLLFIQERSLATMGSFVTFGMLYDALDWAITEPTVAGPYLFTANNLKVLASLVLIVGATVAAHRWAPRLAPEWIRKRRSRLVLVPGFAVAAIAWIPVVPSSAANTSALVSAATVLFQSGENDPGRFAGMRQEDLSQRFREMTHSPAQVTENSYRGLASGFDVILFMLETTPYRSLPIGELPLADFPTLTRLRKHAFVGPSHYTTYPKTSQALFSVFSGLYPPSRDAFRLTGSAVDAPGLAGTLRRKGYETTLYSPVDLDDPDRRMFLSLGIESIVIGNPDGASSAKPAGESLPYSATVERRIALDRQILDAARQDRERCAKSNRHYLQLLMHQISHAPWADVAGRADADVYRKGRALCALEDGWLGEIVAHLEKIGRLDQTLIVVFGDHGVRSRLEDPALHADRVEDVSFHVPMLIYCGKALREGRVIRERTSHIDLCATVLTLMGIPFDSHYCQGVPVWQAASDRTLYFWAREMMGSEGFVSGDRFAMYRPADGLGYSGERMSSDAYHRLLCGSLEHQAIVENLRTMRALQGQWTRNVLAKAHEDRRERMQARN
jgi:hypothetical protein